MTRSEAAQAGGLARAARLAPARRREIAAMGFQALVDPPPITPDLHQGEAK